MNAQGLLSFQEKSFSIRIMGLLHVMLMYILLLTWNIKLQLISSDSEW